MIRLFVVGSFLVFGLVSCRSAQPSDRNPKVVDGNVEMLATLHIEGRPAPGNHVFTSQSDYEEYFGGRQWWLPEVDFERHMVVAVSAGLSASAGGVNIRILGAVHHGDTVSVQVEKTLPGLGCPSTADATIKSSVALFRRVGTTYNFDVKEKTLKACSRKGRSG